MFWKTGLKWVFQGKIKGSAGRVPPGALGSVGAACFPWLWLRPLWSLIPLPQLFKALEGWLELNHESGRWARRRGRVFPVSLPRVCKSRPGVGEHSPPPVRAESALAEAPVGVRAAGVEWGWGTMGTPPGLQGCEYLGLGPSFWWIIWNL